MLVCPHMKWFWDLAITIRDSFYNPAAYSAVAKKDLSSAFFYASIAAVLNAAFIVGLMMPFLWELSQIDTGPEAVDEIYPEGLQVMIQKGQVFTNAVEPLQIEANGLFVGEKSLTTQAASSSEHKYILTIDTKRPLTLEDVRAYDSYLVLGKSTLYAQKNSNEIRSYDLSEIQELEINEGVVKSYAQKARPWILAGIFALPLIVLVFFGIGVLVYFLFLALFGALLVKIAARIRGFSLPYAGAYAVALYATIPVTVFNVVADIIGFGNSFFTSVLVFVLVVMINLKKDKLPEDSGEAEVSR